MKRFILPCAVALSLVGASVAFAQDVTTSAQTDAAVQNQSSVTFPIAELGNCASKAECKAYCDVAAHHDACFSFAESHGLMSKGEVDAARTIVTQKGPGGCDGKDSCQAYCDDSSHTDECLAFAQEHGLIKAEEAKAIQEIRKNGGPGHCTTDKECRSYCSDPSHRDECAAFAKEHGLQGPDQGPGEDHGPGGANKQQFESKAVQILSQKPGPGGCTDTSSCKTYCSDPSHTQECIAFAKENGLMSSDEADRAAKFAGQTGPGGCKGEQCKQYCDDPSHTQECVSFAKQEGLIDDSQAQKFEQNASFTGPGGCMGSECRDYCSDPSHQDECMQFAKEHGLNTGGPQEGDQQEAEQSQGDHTGKPPFDDNGANMPFRSANSKPDINCNDHPEACASVRGQLQGKGDTQGVGKGGQLPPNAPCATAAECNALREKMQQQNGSDRPVPSSVRPVPPQGTSNSWPGAHPEGDKADIPNIPLPPSTLPAPSSLGAAAIEAFIHFFGK